ncbi:hypothetical protein J3B02_000487 [Coemansia erecta]|uniref:WW domain-containing protein n=1 Tax=Coemansia asiatica TaxID=1052880 RepID=A0A9W7XNJ5_9FUNG|nr:hypothetical protein LPJ64_001692 [Coemansia asiatica]KAJ2858147.1 hypothetical protein J3B02_000487 [Coemansia erecta]KAJ2885936.1 hypothetical protein FB639_001671 [Coemansia asiatica]
MDNISLQPSPLQALASIDAGHNWVKFLAPTIPQGQHLPQEPYFFDLNTKVSTWIRPFDYREPPDAQEYAQKLVLEHQQKIRQMARRRALEDRPLRKNAYVSRGWSVVETVQGREYFYNEQTGQATWQKPQEIIDQPVESNGESKDVEMEDEGGTEMNIEDAEWMMQQIMMEQENEQDLRDEISASEEEPRIEDMSKEQAVREFKEMLREGHLNVYGTWDSQIPMFQGDKRFQFIQNPLERQDLFDQICNELVAEKKKPNRQHTSSLEVDPLKAPKKPRIADTKADSTKDLFDQLLEEKVTKKTSFARFCQKHLKDPRYLSLKTSREREKRFLKHIETLGK